MRNLLMTFTMLILVNSSFSINCFPTDSIPPSTPDSSLRATEAEQRRFNLAYLTLMQQWNRAKSLQKEVDHQNKIIKLYEKETGIFRADSVLMKKSFEMQKLIIDECPSKLTDCTENLVIFKSRSKNRGISILIGFPLIAVAGYATGRVIEKIK